jgi:hypothetical protein
LQAAHRHDDAGIGNIWPISGNVIAGFWAAVSGRRRSREQLFSFVLPPTAETQNAEQASIFQNMCWNANTDAPFSANANQKPAAVAITFGMSRCHNHVLTRLLSVCHDVITTVLTSTRKLF